MSEEPKAMLCFVAIIGAAFAIAILAASQVGRARADRDREAIRAGWTIEQIKQLSSE